MDESGMQKLVGMMIALTIGCGSTATQGNKHL